MLRHRPWLLIPLQALLLQAPAVLAQTSDTQFVPEGYRGPVCMALAPKCMTASQWAKVCRTSAVLLWPSSKSCRDARAQARIAENPEPEPPIRFLPEDHTGPVCLALLPGCMTRSQWAQVCEGRRADDPDYVYPRSCREALEPQETQDAAEVDE